jgi:MerR family transcriptional regulator, light-induced transcriptional regulator
MSSIAPPLFYRIGAVSKLANVPVTTLRIWETRYRAFTPTKTLGQHRLYGQDDVLRATLLKQLSEQGHAVSGIALLDSTQLRLLHTQGLSTSALQQVITQARPLSACVVGTGLAQRLGSTRHKLGLFAEHSERAKVFSDLTAARAATERTPTDLLLIRLNTIQDSTVSELLEFVRRCRATHTLLLYVYGASSNLQTLSNAGITVRKDSISDAELSEWVRNASLEQALRGAGATLAGRKATPKKYSDETLSRVANISTAVLCECPRHVAELLAQLSSFEQYSQECLNKNSADQQLHEHLAEVSGQARALFEHALELIAAHEGITL